MHGYTHIIRTLVNFGCGRQAHVNRMRYFAAWNNNEAVQRVPLFVPWYQELVWRRGPPPPPLPSSPHPRRNSPVYLSVGFFFLFARKNHEGFRARFASSKVSVRCGASQSGNFLKSRTYCEWWEGVAYARVWASFRFISPSPSPSSPSPPLPPPPARSSLSSFFNAGKR